MAIDSQLSLDPAGKGSVIENEIPAYRAVSARAVTSIIFGLASVFCFISLNFLLVVAVAIAFGWSALIAIRRYPEVLTGSRIAWTGIILSASIGVTATARQFLEDAVLKMQAKAFATHFVDVVKKEPLANAVWYMQNVAYRKDKTPDAIIEELKNIKNQPGLFESQTHETEDIKARLREPNQDLHFERVENVLVDGLTHYANVLLDIDGPASAKYPNPEEFVLLELVKEPNGGNQDWKIRSVRYPYKPASMGLQAEPKADDGHGHSH